MGILKECISQTKASKLICEENKRKITFVNKQKRLIEKIKVT